MFSANENIMLRQCKRRIIEYVEDCIPEDALDMGTSVMVMQVSCRSPGCVPLETLICIVFPKSTKPLLEGLSESCGGTYKTKVLKQMSDVVKDDVLEALPPAFPGGRRSMKKLCVQARDVMLSQITQIVGDDDLEGRQLMAHYLKECLSKYLKRDCAPPEWGEEYPEDKNEGKQNYHEEKDSAADQKSDRGENHVRVENTSLPSGNFVVRRVVDDAEDEDVVPVVVVSEPSLLETPSKVATAVKSAESSVNKSAQQSSHRETAMDWRRRQGMDKEITSQLNAPSIISRLAQREHAAGVRRPGCPCCDPDNPSNFVDSMMML